MKKCYTASGKTPNRGNFDFDYNRTGRHFSFVWFIVISRLAQRIQKKMGYGNIFQMGGGVVELFSDTGVKSTD